MSKQDITIQLDEEIIQRAQALVARRGMSLSTLLSHQIAALAAVDERYEEARRRALDALDRASDRAATSVPEGLQDGGPRT
ncbi:hypothetical protein ACQPZF_06795 [Actinosynnema sp. CS-041913]|uniref:hypothetical protein n=1 Tax=Actinosynnema sp. CS-041913 TaxID=3239917 RepID=UPI003D8B313E